MRASSGSDLDVRLTVQGEGGRQDAILPARLLLHGINVLGDQFHRIKTLESVATEAEMTFLCGVIAAARPLARLRGLSVTRHPYGDKKLTREELSAYYDLPFNGAPIGPWPPSTNFLRHLALNNVVSLVGFSWPSEVEDLDIVFVKSDAPILGFISHLESFTSLMRLKISEISATIERLDRTRHPSTLTTYVS